MIYIVNGFPGSGKTTFEDLVQNEVGSLYCYKLSTVDFVKDVAEYCGWDRTKTPENRKFLSDLKDLLTQWNDVPYKKIQQRLRAIQSLFFEWEEGYKHTFIFIDCREPKEIEKLKNGFGAKTLFVDNGKIPETSNHADANVLDYVYDIIINNKGTLEDLQSTVKEFIKDEKASVI